MEFRSKPTIAVLAVLIVLSALLAKPMLQRTVTTPEPPFVEPTQAKAEAQVRSADLPLVDSAGAPSSGTTADSTTPLRSRAEEDLDWHVGPFAGLYWQMPMEELAWELRPSTTNGAGPDCLDIIDMPLPIEASSERLRELRQGFMDSKRVFVHVPSYGSVKFGQGTKEVGSASIFNVQSTNQDLVFVNRFSGWSAFYNSTLRQVGRNSEISVADAEAIGRPLLAACESARLDGIIVYPLPGDAGRTSSRLRTYLGEESSQVSTPAITLYLVTRTSPPESLMIWYTVNTWIRKNVQIQSIDLIEDGRIVEARVVLRPRASSSGLVAAYANRPGVLQPQIVDDFMASVRSKNWAVGYGWVRETLGPPLDVLGAFSIPRQAEFWQHVYGGVTLSLFHGVGDGSNLLYLIDFGVGARLMHLSFGDGSLTEARILPLSQSDLALTAMKSDLRSLSTAEAAYFRRHSTYTNALPNNYFLPSRGVTVTITSASANGWAATASHGSTSKRCTISYSNGVSTPPAGRAICK